MVSQKPLTDTFTGRVNCTKDPLFQIITTKTRQLAQIRRTIQHEKGLAESTWSDKSCQCDCVSLIWVHKYDQIEF